jgi:hypothetical protein
LYAGEVAQKRLTQKRAACDWYRLVLGLNLHHQVPQKIQHVFPAAVPLWRSLLSVLAAIEVGLALRSLK